MPERKSNPQLEEFDPQRWLDAFERVGGGWIVRDCLSLVVQVDGRTVEEQRDACNLLVSLTRTDRQELIAFLASRTTREAHDG